MIWDFCGRIISKQILPDFELRYTIEVTRWNSSDILENGLTGKIGAARKLVEITSLSKARDSLLNLAQNGAVALDDSVNASEISYMRYYHDPSLRQDDFLSVIVGLDADSIMRIATNLDQMLFSRNMIHVIGSGGFSVSENNPYSKQPTYLQFETGRALKFNEPVKIILYPDVANSE